MRGILVSAVLITTFTSIAILLHRRYSRRIAEVPAYVESYWDVLKEKRRSLRFKEKLPVTCTITEEDDSLHRVFSNDISGEGICLKVAEILPVGKPLELTIEMPNDKALCIRGEVVWIYEAPKDNAQSERCFDTGIKFTGIDPQERQRLNNFLKNALEEKGEKEKEGVKRYE